jgi:hypothetical protein
LKDLGVDGIKISLWLFYKYVEGIWTSLSWLRIGTAGELE